LIPFVEAVESGSFLGFTSKLTSPLDKFLISGLKESKKIVNFLFSSSVLMSG